MSVFILSNRKIVRHKGENKDSFSNEEFSLPNFRIAKCDFSNHQESTATQKKKKDYKNRKILDYKILSEPQDQGYSKVLELLKKQKGLVNSAITPDHLGGTQRMFYELYKDMLGATENSRKDVLIFIHGYAYDFDDELKAILDLKKLFLDDPESPIEHILFVSWPASSTVFPLTYFDDKASSINAGNSLMRLFYMYTQFLKDVFSSHELTPCRQRVHLMAHSMGNRVLQSMMYSLKTENIARVIDQVLLLNSDVSYSVFEDSENSFVKLPLLANRISIYMNRKDNILTISQFSKNILSPRLGKMGPSNLEKIKKTVAVIDCTDTKNDLLKTFKFEFGEHWGYLSSSMVRNHIVNSLSGMDYSLMANCKMENNNFYRITAG